MVPTRPIRATSTSIRPAFSNTAAPRTRMCSTRRLLIEPLIGSSASLPSAAMVSTGSGFGFLSYPWVRMGSGTPAQFIPYPPRSPSGRTTAVYYRGDHVGHGTGGRPGIGVAFLDRGGFVAWEAEARGTLTTHPLAVGGSRETLYVNGDASGGSIRAELLDTDGEVIPGFSRQESLPISGRGPRLLVRWKGKPDLVDAVLRPFRLKLYLERARVYGIGCARH